MPELRGKAPKRASAEPELIVIGGREIAVSNPTKVLFPKPKYTKGDVVRYYLAVAGGALQGAGDRPNVLVRYPNGVGGEFFYQKRAPDSRPPWLEVVTISFPSGRTAAEIVPRDAAALAWMANLGCLELHPHPVRADDLDHPDELRVDLDPGPGVSWEDVRRVALVAREALEEHGLRGWPKTSGSRGMHINVRIERRWTFDQVRRAALALARDVERRAPALATSAWWKEERHGVFIDYNQNAKDRTVASAWSVRPTPDARVSMPLDWDEVADCDPTAFTLLTAPKRFAERGNAAAGLERWKARHPEAAKRLEVDDVLVDPMRGRYTTWTRIRVNLRHVPEGERPAEEPPDPDYDPWEGWEPGGRSNLYPPSYRNAGKSRGSSKD